jgi:hypothetical protein
MRALLLLLLAVAAPAWGQGYRFPIPDVGPSYQTLTFAPLQSTLAPPDYEEFVRTFPQARNWTVGLADLDMDGVAEVIHPVRDSSPSVFKRVESRWIWLDWLYQDFVLQEFTEGFYAVRDEVQDGMRTLYSNVLFADVASRKYTIRFPKPNRGPDERVLFRRQAQLSEVEQRMVCDGPCSYADRLVALVDLDGDGVANWLFAAQREAANQQLNGEYYVGTYLLEDGTRRDMGIDFSVRADERDGLPAIYLRDEFAGTEYEPMRTYYSSRNGPRQRVPFE